MPPYSSAESDMDGHFTVKAFAPGDYIIHVEREGFFDLASEPVLQSRSRYKASIA